MSKKTFLFLTIVLITSLSFSQPDLEQIYSIDLKRLEETWNILDQYAEKICKGWTGYTDVPFYFEYPNGVKMLVGHPKPPKKFIEVTGIAVRDKKVYMDRTKEIPLKLGPPLLGGGGLTYYAGRRAVWIRLRDPEVQKEVNKKIEENIYLKSASEFQIRQGRENRCREVPFRFLSERSIRRIRNRILR